ncbi:MAG: hypothetical protein KDD70_01230 [Bdellovibrionales bacterium]|nr:hypothetical protein [Bdellovibrionales bacterium]
MAQLLQDGKEQSEFALSTPVANITYVIIRELHIDKSAPAVKVDTLVRFEPFTIHFIGARNEQIGELHIPSIPPSCYLAARLATEKLKHLDHPTDTEEFKAVSAIINHLARELDENNVEYQCDLGKTPSGIARRLTRLQRTSLLEKEWIETGTIKKGSSRELDLMREQAADDLHAALRDPVANLEAVEAQCLALELSTDSKRIEPLDITRVRGLQSLHLPGELPYRVYAADLYVRALAAQKEVVPTTVEGFKSILPEFSKDSIRTTPVTAQGSTSASVIDLAYGGSPAPAILDLVASHPDYRAIREVGLTSADFPTAPNGTWTDDREEPTRLTRDLVVRSIRVLAGRSPEDDAVWTAKTFRLTIPKLTISRLRKTEVNIWGTTPAAAIRKAYGDSPSKAVLDAVMSYPEFKPIQTLGLTEFDLSATAKGLWSENGEPTAIARFGVRRLLETIAYSISPKLNPTSPEDFKEILPHFVRPNFSQPVGVWKRDLSAMMSTVYRNSPTRALQDLARHDREFAFLKDLDLQ